MERPTNQGYLTRDELAEVLELRKKYGKEGIRQFLRKQREKQTAGKRRVQTNNEPGSNGTE